MFEEFLNAVLWYCAIVGAPLLTALWFVIHIIADTIAERRYAAKADNHDTSPAPARVLRFARDTVRVARRQHRRVRDDEDPLKRVA